RRALDGETAADTMTAILMKEPPDLSQTSREIHPGLDRIVRHCLEKNVQERFQSAGDVAFDLEALSGVSVPGVVVAVAPSATPRARLLPVLVPIALAVFAAAGLFAGKKIWNRPLASFH